MPTPKLGYYLKDGTRVPGTTTVIGRFKDSGALMYWNWEQGMKGIPYNETKKKAASIGSAAHAMVEGFIRGDQIVEIPPEVATDKKMLEQATSAFEAYKTWAKNFRVQIIEQEIQLVSEQYRYGGTPDAIGLIDNQLVLLDWKTSNSIYSDYLIQLAAYKHLWEENYPDRLITGGAHLLRFAKENGDFAHHYFANLTDEWEQFLDFRRCYERDKRISKRAA